MNALFDINLSFWLMIGGGWLVSFLFSGVEAGILSLNPVRFRHQVQEREPGALTLQPLLQSPERLLLSVVIVTSALNILTLALITNLLVKAWGGAGYAVALGALLPLYLFGLQLLPKALFRRFPDRTLVFLSRPLRLATVLLDPLLRLIIGLSGYLIPASGREPRKLFGSREDLKFFTRESERAGLLTPEACHLIHGVVDFRAVQARHLMQPLADFVTVPPETDVQTLVAMSRGGSVERFVVVAETGEVIGLVNLFEALLDRKPQSRISAYVRRLTPVPEDEPAPDLMRKLRAARTPVALVMEEHKPVGIVLGGMIYRRLFAPAAGPV